jgi:hypothetical protein
MKLAAALLFVSMAVAAADPPRNGNWWRNVPEHARTWYALGLLDGVSSAEWLRMLPGKRYDPQALRLQRTLKPVGSGQLADGLTVFYDDFRNRNIPAPCAVWLVTLAINNAPSQDINRELAFLRNYALAYPQP